MFVTGCSVKRGDSFLRVRLFSKKFSRTKRLDMQQVRFGTFDEAARHTEQVMRAPPVEPAESGNDFYTAQPFQVLSWYPRRAPSLPASDAVNRLVTALLDSGRMTVSGGHFD